MQTDRDAPRPRRVTGDLPPLPEGTPVDVRSALPLARMQDLGPMEFDLPLPQEGLRMVSFTDGLDEISVSALRANGAASPLMRGAPTSERLAAAARRSTELGLFR